MRYRNLQEVPGLQLRHTLPILRRNKNFQNSRLLRRDPRRLAIKVVVSNRCGAREDTAPLRIDRFRVVMGCTTGQRPRFGFHRQFGNFSHPFVRALIRHVFRTSVASIGELTAIPFARALVDHTTNRGRIPRIIDTVQDHFGNSKDAFHLFTARFEIQCFGQTRPFGATCRGWQAVDVRARIKPLGFFAFGRVNKPIQPTAFERSDGPSLGLEHSRQATTQLDRGIA